MQEEFDTSCIKDQINLCTEMARAAVVQYFHSPPRFPTQSPLEEKMTSHVKLRRERIGLIDYETQIKGNII